MDRLEIQRKSVKAFLQQYADSINQHLESGIEFDLKDGKIWLQENNTGIDVDEYLEEMGISNKEIVVVFHHLLIREYSDYATA